MLIAAGGCAGDSSQPQGQSSLRFVNAGLQRSSASPNAARGGTAKQRVLLRSLIASIDGDSIRLVELGRPPSGWRADRRLRAHGDTWLTVHVRAQRDPLAEVTALWKAHLLAGAFRDRAHERGLATVLGFTDVLEYPGGQRRRNGQLMTGPFAHRVREDSPARLAQALRRGLEELDRAGGIERVQLRFVRPIHLAPVLDVVATEPLVAAREVRQLKSLKLEGWLLRIESPDGRPRAVRSSAVRARLGASWTRS